MSPFVRRLSITALSLVGGFALIALLSMSLFNQLIADDVSYFQYFRNNYPWDFLYWIYFELNGRLLQAILVVIGYSIAGAASVKIMPLVLYILLAIAASWATHRFVPWKRKNYLQSIAAGTAIAGTVIFTMPSIYDSYLWWTSSSIYLASIIVLIVDICFIDMLLKKKNPFYAEVPILLFILIGQTLSEITSIILIGSAALALLYHIIKKNKTHIKTLLKIFCALTIGFLVTYLSPGSMARRASEDGGSMGFDFTRIFILSTKHFFELISSVSIWEICLVLTISLTLGLLTRSLTKKQRKNNFIGAGLILFIGAYGSFCVNNYVTYNMPYRALSLPSFSLTVATIIVVAVLTNHLLKSFKKNKATSVILAIAVILISVVTLVGMARTSQSMITFMVARDAAYSAREKNISNQLSKKSADISIEALPILVKSQATDLTYGAKEQVDWYEHALKSRNLIPEGTQSIVIPPPAGYCVYGKTSSTACMQKGDNTISSKIIKKLEHFMIYYFSLNH